MKLDELPLADAVGAVLVHTVRADRRVLKKGHVLAASDLDALAAAGHTTVTCARLEAGELGEDAAAAAIAAALEGPHVAADRARTGRANLRARVGGVVSIDASAIAHANAFDEAITIATLANDVPVRAGEIVATVKIIPFAVPAGTVEAAAVASKGALELHRWQPRRAALVLTRFADTPASVLDRAVASQRARLARLDSALVRDIRVSHDASAVADAISACAAEGLDPILVLGASAIMDRRDVVPAALVRAGGSIVRFGMPVDPGNLLLLGSLGTATVIGVPGCARTLERSGFDWVLERTCAGLAISSAQIAALGVGGLLTEGPRPSPRALDAAGPEVAAIVLAAGRASRMGENKLLADLDGQPLIRRTVAAALASRARPVIVVTGNQAELVRSALAGLDVTFVHNPDFATGMASSLRAGISAVDEASGGALICLGDMPRVTAAHINALVDAFDSERDDGAIIVPTCERKRGNPVLWGRRHFAEIHELSGDVGARAIIERHAGRVRSVAIDDPAILLDVDTPEALASLRR